MEEALEMARAKDTKERMAGVERLHQVLEATTKSLSTAEVTALVDACMDLLKDSNFRVSQGALQALSAAAVLSGEHLKLHFNGLVPAVVERLGDGKQPVRDAARQLLITLMEVGVSSPTIIVERAGSYAWTHRSWRVREEFARTVTTAIGLFASTELPLQRVLQLLTDSNQSVREAATLCIEVSTRCMHKVDLNFVRSCTVSSSFFHAETRPSSANHKKSSPKTKMAPRETSFSSGDIDAPEKPVAPIKVYSEKELMREMEKIASTLVPEKDWSLRIAAMQRVESLVLLKLVVITVLVIAESADNCIKTMLRNCKVARVLPRIADAAKNDKSAVLRARCCEYALLILEYWADAPEIQRSADLYEDLIKCCVADAMSEIINEEDGGVDAPSTRDPLVPSVSSPDLFSAQSSVLVDSIVANITKAATGMSRTH
ncbi:HEAT repeat family protein [Musa troglodytarum]|uniref:HEAT repeat family protein n=1 Tax=Musa troglodytarum TaxID=320322 RepID=A0A9E7EQT5_9LILI|nr:HEAT repeat family protein [Musa troglodytarum]